MALKTFLVIYMYLGSYQLGFYSLGNQKFIELENAIMQLKTICDPAAYFVIKMGQP